MTYTITDYPPGFSPDDLEALKRAIDSASTEAEAEALANAWLLANGYELSSHPGQHDVWLSFGVIAA